MVASSQERDEGRPVSPYRRESDDGSRFGDRTTCELCETRTLCYPGYGLTACRDCHHELLPGGGMV